ncbi:multiple sugar transport system permease protein [Arthrobacter pascens]|uniref:carbohydrate ABC transporter permease n=1 Tax=Arthrobacter pascens TaxID=1677 RepID=UPI002791FCD4|nr:carbohydrate ABC transporter permease [Arthrobacter pascens]MDQ0680303.1 multiple sugar transport system permease protein [Arthrobacter pascens]
MTLTSLTADSPRTEEEVQKSALKPRRRNRPKKFRDGDDSSELSGKRGGSRIVVIIGLVLFALYSIGPAWWLVVSSTKTKEDLYTTDAMWFANFSLFDNLASLFTYQDGIFGVWLWNSTLYAFAGSIGHTLVSLAAGYGLAMYSFRGKGTTMGFIIGSFLIPGALLTIPSYLLFVQMGLYDTIWAMIIPAFFSPFAVYLAKIYAEGAVPSELLEAARIDGAGEYRIFFQIASRLMTTAGATIFLLHFVGSWNAFFGPMVFLRGDDKWPVMLGLYSWLQRGTDSTVDLTGLVITGSLVATIPMVVLMVAMQRYWRSGVAMGSLK